MLVIGNLPRYTCAKNYQNRASFDKAIAKIKWCSFLLTWYNYTEDICSVFCTVSMRSYSTVAK